MFIGTPQHKTQQLIQRVRINKVNFMKKELNPILIIVAIILLVIVLGFFLFRAVSPPPPTIVPTKAGFEDDGASAKRERYFKAHGHYPTP